MPDFRCTYRIQLNCELGFRTVRETVLAYVRDLGVSHLYLSPVMKARKGSEHGYDVVETPAAEFVRWQQTTDPVMAKGVEDTAFYRWFRLAALNEVGGNPDRFSLSPDEFHAAALERLERHPRTLLASQTHATKRAGDVRARVTALGGSTRSGAAASAAGTS